MSRKHYPLSQGEIALILLGLNHAELTYYLPTSAVKNFPPLFTKLEEQQPQLGVIGFGVAIATMEKVFQRFVNAYSASCSERILVIAELIKI